MKVSHLVLAASLLAALGTSPTLAMPIPGNHGTPISEFEGIRTILITERTRHVNVNKFESVRFVVRARDGRETSFAWRFDTLGAPVLALADIAPQGLFGDRSIKVYVYAQPIGS
jgi:hypothetical protein